jgi:hypothetical protein
MPPPTRADCTIYNQPFGLPFSILSALASWKRNVIQLLHTMFVLYKELKKRWKKIVRAVWKKVRGTEVMPDNLLDLADAPKSVTQAMQEPLVTRW